MLGLIGQEVFVAYFAQKSTRHASKDIYKQSKNVVPVQAVMESVDLFNKKESIGNIDTFNSMHGMGLVDLFNLPVNIGWSSNGWLVMVGVHECHDNHCVVNESIIYPLI